jgi:hypothetical protein
MESFYIFEELAATGSATQMLLVGQAVSKMECLLFSEAETLLIESMNKVMHFNHLIL